MRVIDQEEIIDADRKRIVAEILAEIDARPIRTDVDRSIRLGMALAANIVRRGRRLTAHKKLVNLANALAEEEPPVDITPAIDDAVGAP